MKKIIVLFIFLIIIILLISNLYLYNQKSLNSQKYCLEHKDNKNSWMYKSVMYECWNY